jgi:hypothetical protein
MATAAIVCRLFAYAALIVVQICNFANAGDPDLAAPGSGPSGTAAADARAGEKKGEPQSASRVTPDRKT